MNKNSLNRVLDVQKPSRYLKAFNNNVNTDAII